MDSVCVKSYESPSRMNDKQKRKKLSCKKPSKLKKISARPKYRNF